MNIDKLISGLDRGSLMFLVMVGFNKDEVVNVRKNENGWKFEMKDGSTINV